MMSSAEVDSLYEDYEHEMGGPTTPKPGATMSPSEAAASMKPAPVAMERKKIRCWIQYTHEGMGMPARLKRSGEDQWIGQGGVAVAIARHLDIKWDSRCVVKVLERTYDAFLSNQLATFDAGVVTFKKKKARVSDPEIQIALKCVRDNLGLDLATKRVNTYRKRVFGANDRGVARETVRKSMERWGRCATTVRPERPAIGPCLRSGLYFATALQYRSKSSVTLAFPTTKGHLAGFESTGMAFCSWMNTTRNATWERPTQARRSGFAQSTRTMKPNSSPCISTMAYPGTPTPVSSGVTRAQRRSMNLSAAVFLAFVW
jgi:hypothetical protein